MQDSDSSPTQVTRKALVQAGNDRVVAAAQRHHFEDTDPLPVICECDEDDCREFVRATVAEIRAARDRGDLIFAPGHGPSEAQQRRDAFHDVALPADA